MKKSLVTCACTPAHRPVSNIAVSGGVQHWKAQPELSVFHDRGTLRL
jgi:hypothetical protein